MQARKSMKLDLRVLLFLVMTLTLCLAAFNGMAVAGYADSAHGDATYGVDRTGTSYVVGSCAHCHDTFDPDICAGGTGYGPHMLFAELDNPDFCMECHTDTGSVQDGGMPGAPGDIEDVFTKTYRHNVTGYSGLHKFWYATPPAESSSDVENRTYLSANKHVECNDCHNPHTAGSALHSSNEEHVSAAGNEIAGIPLAGAFGIEPDSWNSNWSGADWTGVTTSSTATKEYQVCFKCHSDYNTNFSSWGGTFGPYNPAWTNVALEFNPSNQSYHPVVAALPASDPGVNGSSRLPPAFTSLLIGDSGLSNFAKDATIQIDPSNINGKQWTTNEWVNWGVRVGTLVDEGNWAFNQVGRITSNSTIALGVTWQYMLGLASGVYDSDVVYSIEYYAGHGSKNGVRITDNYKDFSKYLPSLVGYQVVIFSSPGSSQQYAIGTVNNMDPSTPSRWFEVEGWIPWENPDPNLVPAGGVPPDGTGEKTVGYYFSGTGQTMMCSDCHSNDEISTTAAQGPHGSAVKWMLKGRNKAWPTLLKSENGSGTGTLRNIGPRTASNPYRHRAVMDGNPNGNGLFCLNCHSTVGFSKDKYGVQNLANVHVLHGADWGAYGPGCVRCHILVPHGGKLSRLMGDQEVGVHGSMPLRYAFANDRSNMWMTTFQKSDDPANYAPGDDWCSVNCHPDSGGNWHTGGGDEDWDW